jgi:alcohol dehydrogenase class IV
MIEAPAAINLPRIIEFGAGASANLAAVLGRLGHSRPFLVVDGHLLRSGLLDRVIGPLDGAFEHRVFSDIVPDPTVAAVRRGLAALAEGAHDCVVGIGGGSALDTAKALAVFSVLGGDPADYKAPHVQDAPGLPPSPPPPAPARKPPASPSSPTRPPTKRCSAPASPTCRWPPWWTSSSPSASRCG